MKDKRICNTSTYIHILRQTDRQPKPESHFPEPRIRSGINMKKKALESKY